MTYGWAILIIVIIGGALFALGVFNPSNWVSSKRATGFAALQIQDWTFTATAGGSDLNDLTLVLNNKFGDQVTLNSIYTNGTSECSVSYGGEILYPDSRWVSVPATCNTRLPRGQVYSLQVVINYTANSLSHLDFGTIGGKAE